MSGRNWADLRPGFRLATTNEALRCCRESIHVSVLTLSTSARNKLVMVSLATENRRTLEVEEVPIRPSKPFFFSKVAAYVGEERVDEPPPRQ